MAESLEKFQILLRELFQFDCADLDFGIYRIMNHKRQVIDDFIFMDLPKAINNELKQGALAEQSQAAKELEAAKRKVLDALGDDALNAVGKLSETYINTKAGKEYLALQEKAKSAKSHAALETAIYNHLHAFFSRYYQDGDFISKRRYSKHNRYAIPYNGEEVMLYWANHDQYYIKTGEYFNDYTWKAPNGVTVHFKLKTADVEQNNVKGDKRFFLPWLEEIAWEESVKSLIITFEFRPLNGQEAITYGGKNQQEAIIAKAVVDIPKRLSPKNASLALAALEAEKRHANDGECVTHLEHHLRQYTRRNTSDFFIHKDLRGFLARELDFFLKNEVLNLEEMKTVGQGLSEGWFQMMSLIKTVGSYIIEFLAQIEDFQKMLWEKHKFITETFYCITVCNIPKELYPAIAACDTQWEEWKTLFSINVEKGSKSRKDWRIEFLKNQPTLVLDTRNFSPDFVDRLLESIDNIDEKTDGVLIQSENFQALNLIQKRYKEKVKCIHIDPPYNTATSGFLYKNDYQHSSWITMMADRLRRGWGLLSDAGHFLCHIDENEQERLHMLCDNLQLTGTGTIVWDKKNPMLGRKGIATQHEYILWRSRSDSSVYLKNVNQVMILDKAREIIEKNGSVTEKAKKEFSRWITECPGLSGGERAYHFLNDDGRVYQSASLAAPEPREDQKFFIPLIHPMTRKPCPVPPNGWSRAPETMQQLLDENSIIFGADEIVQPRRKLFLTVESERQVSSVIQDGGRGKTDIDKIGLKFPYCHPVSLYVNLLGAASTKNSSIILDFFAGSGTTGHAVINLNREDNGRRKFILVEMAQYFDTVLLTRIKKITYSPEWKDGKPKNMATTEEAKRSPRIVKVIRLESYEDSLNSIVFDEPSGQNALQFEDYLLQYMLKWETRHSETLLNVEKLVKPFSYKLQIFRNDETRMQTVDLAETFNYLLGLHVQKRWVFSDNDRRYLVYHGITQKGRKVAVLWRETEGWKEKDYKHDKEFVASQKLIEGVDEVYVNGDSYIPGAQSLDPIFKARMFAVVEA